jgi:nitrogen fixation/metabolism regulation signal transduction histidine kinase
VTTKPEGIGLGLYYVHSLAEAIGAELTLDDREFGGAVAKISFPIVPTATTAEPGIHMTIETPNWRPQNG